jgi:hypothetical protein
MPRIRLCQISITTGFGNGPFRNPASSIRVYRKVAQSSLTDSEPSQIAPFFIALSRTTCVDRAGLDTSPLSLSGQIGSTQKDAHCNGAIAYEQVRHRNEEWDVSPVEMLIEAGALDKSSK